MIRPCGHPLTWGVHAGTLPAVVPAWSGGVINGGNRHGSVNIKGMGPNCHNSMVALIEPHQDTHCTGKIGKMATTKIPVRENTGNLEILPKHGEFGLLKL